MDVSLSETQTLLRDSIRDYLRKEVPLSRVQEVERGGGYDRDLWGYLQEAGYLALPFPEDFGGDAGELTDLAVLLEELTRRAAAIPFMETMVSAIAVQRKGDRAVAEELIKGIIAGTTTVSPAILEANDKYDAISLEVSGGKITGEKYFVDYGQVVTHHLVAAKENGQIGLYVVDANAPEVTARPLKTIARTPQANITYQGVAARKAGGEDAYRFLLQLGRALAAIQCLGNAQEALDMAVEYVSMRVQFGRPIGTFQAVQHHCADMATMVEATRFLAYEAIWNVDRGTATDKALAVAKAQASRTSTYVPMQAHQLHGGIGITEEYGLHFFSRHGKERALAWGTFEECLGELADTIEEAEQWL
jgi:alkylation response protein AidB-like acyl-CoA dehydrogenase